MARVSQLNRLLRLRELEEDQARLAFEVAAEARQRVVEERKRATERLRDGRDIFLLEAGSADTSRRAGGLAQLEQARRLQARIEPRLAAADAELARQRQEFLNRRIDREQVETLSAEARRAKEIEAGRRAQQMLDDWYGRRIRKARTPHSAGAKGQSFAG